MQCVLQLVPFSCIATRVTMEMQTAALLAAKGRPSVAKLRENSTLIVPVVVPARLIDNSTQPDHIFFPHERSGTSSAEQDMQYKPRAVVGSSARAAYSSIVETVRLSLACKSLRSVLIVQQLERAGAFQRRRSDFIHFWEDHAAAFGWQGLRLT